MISTWRATYKPTKEGKRWFFIWKTCSSLVQWGHLSILEVRRRSTILKSRMDREQRRGKDARPTLVRQDRPETVSGVVSVTGRKRNRHWQEEAFDTQSLKAKCGCWKSKNYCITEDGVSVWRVIRQRGDGGFDIQKFTAKSLFKKSWMSLSDSCLSFYNSFSKLHSSTDLFFIFYYGNGKIHRNWQEFVRPD